MYEQATNGGFPPHELLVRIDSGNLHSVLCCLKKFENLDEKVNKGIILSWKISFSDGVRPEFICLKETVIAWFLEFFNWQSIPKDSLILT